MFRPLGRRGRTACRRPLTGHPCCSIWAMSECASTLMMAVPGREPLHSVFSITILTYHARFRLVHSLSVCVDVH